MIRTLPKWKVTIINDANIHLAEFWVYNDHYQEVLRQVALMQFTANGLEEVKLIHIIREKQQ